MFSVRPKFFGNIVCRCDVARLHLMLPISFWRNEDDLKAKTTSKMNYICLLRQLHLLHSLHLLHLLHSLGSVHILRHQLLANSGPPTAPCVIKIIMALDPPPPLK